MIRKLLERWGRGKVFLRRIQVNGESFPIYVSPDAQLKYIKLGKGVFDQDLIALAEKYLKPESKVWDVGANVGVFTFAAAAVSKDGVVVAIEADIWLANLIRKTKALRQYENRVIHVLPAAVASTNSVASFMVAGRGRASNALQVAGGRSQMGGVREVQHVPTLTLDTLLEAFEPPDFVKIDVEGAELLVLEGASALIRNFRPVFYIEIGQEVAAKVTNIFNDAKYSMFGLDGEKLDSANLANVLFVPQENSSNPA